VTNGGTLALGDLNNSNTISVTNSAIKLFGGLHNPGTITATNSTVNLNCGFIQSDLGTFNHPGSTILLTGSLGGGLTLDANTGSWFLEGGSVQGPISESGGAELAFTSFGGILFGST